MDLAEKGNSLNLDMTEAEITSKADPESEDSSDVMDEIYGKYAKLSPRPTFLWGKAVAADTCKHCYWCMYDCEYFSVESTILKQKNI